MRTIDLSVMQRHNQKRIRKEVAENVGAAHSSPKTVVINETIESSASESGNGDMNQRNNRVERSKTSPLDGTDAMTPEELETYLDDYVRRTKIKSNLTVEQDRIEAEQSTQIQENQAVRERAGIDIDAKTQQAKLQAERELLADEAKTNELRNKMDRQDLETQQMRIDQETQGINNREREHQLTVEQRKENSEARRQKINRIFRTFLMVLLAILLLIILAGFGYRMWRWSVEEPLIKEVIEEVVVEKEVIEEVIKEVEVEKEVIPPECTQIRRNGKVYVSCDGVNIDGAPTISESGVEVPELLGDPEQ